MIRQNKDGRPIYSDKIWNQISETGRILEKLGYRESKNKPNLFYKTILISNHEKEGAVFVDIRGTDIIPIWEDPRPIAYPSKGLPFQKYIKEVVYLKRSGCSIRLTFYDKFEPDGWAFLLDDIPSGYCLRCGKDILNECEWEILKEGIYNKKLTEENLDLVIEVKYCKICKKIEYAKKTFRNEYLKSQKLCELCRKNESTIEHHIKYNPPKIIEICNSCHGKIHNFGKNFPNPLWKDRRDD